MEGFAHQDSWRQRVCSGRRVIFILMGLLALVTLSLVVLGFMGRKYSATLWTMQEDVKTSNHSLAMELVALQEKDAKHLKTMDMVDRAVKHLTEEVTDVKSHILDQIKELQGSFQKLNCDLEDIKHKRTGPGGGCCPKGWHAFAQGCYWLSSQERRWTEAKEDCEEKNAHLVTITSYLEAQFVLRLTKPHDAWIGLKYNGQVWKWVDGTPYTVRRM
ncbi:asialoglycoprotein receptor 1-like [Pseudonaja textilis]|uniref:asialoglycoprotein receptor 1-like n=1 Tax=Pseudonaja textilis TaxID=8673 RepID=UPI000EA8E4D4|nr:asialoglycoprotein receptor 1-like [Pseudonaja textilis]